MKRLIPVFFSLIFLTACTQDKVPAGIMKPDEMVPVLLDMHLVEGYMGSSSLGEDSLKKVASGYYTLVYKKHRLSKEQFRKSLDYYSRRPELLDSIYSSILHELNTQSRQISSSPAPPTAPK